jgi:methylase of polypeptide subunit release factors
MNLEELNTLIEKLTEKPGREGVFELAFALIDWIGLQPVEDKKPRLLAPQTQKLKEYLVPVPTTVQPQLYRLTADGQPVRVRFAALKRIKKEYIYQLVDNDPGLTSYQASIKGIVNLPGRPAYIPSEPYFIHFITTPDYNKLIVVFNQGDQKRIITFRNRLTQTQYYRVVKQWHDIGLKSKSELSDLFWRSLDVKEVNKEFYLKIKERFDDLVGLIQSSANSADENHIKQFAVRLIGRYVFIWFLKEKEIIPSEIIISSTISQYKPGYYQNFLIRLFFQTLNTEVQLRNLSFSNHPLEPLFANIPYLDGGLFEDIIDDRPFHKFVTDEWLISFVKVLESYDFTVDESSVQYQQVAIDPEMLGRIFENLLASQNPETEKLANQRKAFGAFYTPREIVEYMVDTSLTAYLEEALMPSKKTTSSQVKEPIVSYSGTLFHELEAKQTEMSLEPRETYSEADRRKKITEKIDKLFLPFCESNPFDKKETQIIQNALRDIKVLDPACGSGAFPIGMLLRLMSLREIVGNSLNSSYELKNEILSRNIYGVDIMPMAVEIARLRAWLSLVLEVDYKLTDRKHNFNIKALPNLDFKFICANSLIESGYDEFSKRISSTPSLLRLDNEIKKLERLRNEYFDTHGDKDRKSELQTEFIKTKESIKSDFSSLKETWNLEKFLEKIDDWDPFDDSHSSSFFSPAWMFGINDGFDLVMGNPPYVEHKKLKLISLLLKNNYQTYSGTADLYVYFYESSIKLLKNDGILIFITSNKFFRTSYGKNLRKYFINYSINEIIDFTKVHVFEALVASCIFSITKKRNTFGNVLIASADDTMMDYSNLDEFIKKKSFLFPQKYLDENIWQIENETNLRLKQKIEKDSQTLESINTINIYRGVTTGFNPAFIIDEGKRNELINEDKGNKDIIKPLLQGRNIKKWIFNQTNDYLIFTRKGINIKKYPLIEKHLSIFKQNLQPGQGRKPGNYLWYEIQDNTAYYEEFEKEKIIWGLTSDKWTFAYDNENHFLPSNGYILTSSELSIKYLLALMNSKLMEYYFGFIGIMTAGGAFTLKQETVREFPIKKIHRQQQNNFIRLVENILSLKKQNQDTISLEQEIEILVYKLYGLYHNEVKIIDPDFWLNEEEYNKFEVK